jgi:large subunit ribosomal protein L32
MAVPKRRTSKARRDKRRSHHALKASTAIQVCPHCGETKIYHHVCSHCGHYRGERVLEVVEVD